MNPDLDTLVTALYATIDDLLIAHPQWAPERPVVGFAPLLCDAELIALAVLQALLGFNSEARFIRYAKAHLAPWFPDVPERPGYNKQLRRSGELMQHVISALASDCPSFHDDVWVVDSTPVERGRSRETAKRSDLAGWAAYGYSASHSRHFWGLRLHLIATPAGLPIAFALTSATTDERDTCLDMIAHAGLVRPGQTLIADKGYRSAGVEQQLDAAGIALIRPATKSEAPRPGRQFLKPLRQTIESINQTLKAQLSLEQHGGRTRGGVAARILQRLLTLTAVISHNQTTRQPGPARSLIAYDH